MSPEFIERASSVLGVTAAWLAVATALVGGLAWYCADRTSTFKDAELKKFQQQSGVAIASAVADAANANAKAATANERAAGLEKDAAEARLELEQLKENQRPRTITAEMEQSFVGLLRNVLPKGPITVICLSDLQEANRFAKRIRETLDSAGYNDDVNRGVKNKFGLILNTGNNSDDIALCYRPNRRVPYGAKVQDAFEYIGIHMNGVEDSQNVLGLLDNELAIVVISRSLFEPASNR